MSPHIPPADLKNVRTYTISDRPTKTEISNFSKKTPSNNPTLLEFIDSLPSFLKAEEFRNLAHSIVFAYNNNKPIILGIGGHVIKCGLSPLIIELINRGIVSGIMMNGGASIHDFEIATQGRTSENVDERLEDGLFGMVTETLHDMNDAIINGYSQGIGMGEALGKRLVELSAPYEGYSILAKGFRRGIPVLVHVLIGGDTIHMSNYANAAALGSTSYIDFKILVSLVKDLGNGGVYINIGSAVALPEIFLKALNLARNLSGAQINNFTTANMDMIQHYRPLKNVIQRPTSGSGKGIALTGHHEIMIPLLFNLILAMIPKGAINENNSNSG